MMDLSLVENHFLITGIVLGVLALVLLYRVFKGSHVIDRVLAADCIEIIAAFIMVVFACVMGKSLYIDLALVLALLGFIGTVLVSKYMEGKL